MASGRDLIELLLPGNQVVAQAYHESAEFHALLDMVARAAPKIIRTLADDALRAHVELESRIGQMAGLPPLNAEQLRRELGLDGD